MKQKNLVFSLLFLSVFLFSITSVLALTVTLDAPAASSTVSGANINLSVTTDFSTADTWNCTIYAQSTLTANNSWAVLTEINTISNSTNTIWNSTFDSSILEDANNYIFNATCLNSTTTADDTNTGITVDNTSPTAPSAPSPANLGSISVSGTQTFTQTVVGVNTTSCTFSINRNRQTSGPDVITGTSTHTGDTCSFTKTFSSSGDNGNWCWKQIASDETDTATSSESCVSVSLPPAAGGLPAGTFTQGDDGVILAADTEGDSNLIWWILGIAGLLVIGLMVWLIRK